MATQTDSLAGALEREHHEIDAGLAAFAAAPGDRRPLTRAIGALRRHIYLEEAFLFPLLTGAEPGLSAPTFVMLREHAQIWDTLDALEGAPSADTDAAPALLKQLTVQLLHHNLKEEKILYPLADETIPTEAVDRLRVFLDFSTMPEGWICLAKARSMAQRPEAGSVS